MPKIRIIEKDLTPATASGQSDTVVFMAVTGATATPKLLPGTLSATELKTELEKYTEDGGNIEKILNLGGKVLVCDTYAHAKDFITDRNQYDVKFLLVKENATEKATKTDDLAAALEIATKRRDCAVVFAKNKAEYLTEDKTALTAQLSTSTTDAFLDTELKDNVGKYCIPVLGKLTSDGKSFDAGVAYILAFLNSRNKFGAEWLAVAGSRKGAIPVNGLTAGDLTESEIDNMQPREVEVADTISVNPICNVTPWGVRIWGNRTALPLQPIKGTTTKYGLVASSFANIRVLICDIKKALYKAARGQQFEQNTDVLWVNFTSEVNQLLEQMVQSYGIAGYKWIRTETKERAKLTAILRIVPIEPVEDFDLTIELADSLEVTE